MKSWQYLLFLATVQVSMVLAECAKGEATTTSPYGPERFSVWVGSLQVSQKLAGKRTHAQAWARGEALLGACTPCNASAYSLVMESDAQDAQLRVGVGYDVHKVKAGRKLVLGGIEIPSDFGCDAHSDGDVIAHALADAILGAVALPDIGHYFPPSDPACEGIDSMKILAKAVSEARSRGYKPSNVDVAVIAERPKIGTFIPAMREKLSAVLGVPADCVGIKATTNEGLGDIGKGLGIAAQAVCLLQRI